VNAVIRGEYENDNVIQSLPFNNRVLFSRFSIRSNSHQDMNVAKILKLRLKGVNEKLKRAKQLVHDLRHKREEIRLMLVREERKRKEAGYQSPGGSSNSISVSVERGGHAHRSHNQNYMDDLNESFFSMNTSISRSPINRDRITTTSIETSFVDNRRENRFGATHKKSPISRNSRRPNQEEGFLLIPDPTHADLKLSSNNSQSDNLARDFETSSQAENKEVSKVKTRAHKLTFSKKDTPDWGAADRKTMSSEKTEEDAGETKIQLKVNGEGGEFSKRDDLLKLISEMKDSKSRDASGGPATKSDIEGDAIS